MGAVLLRHLYTSRTVLNKIRSLTGSQWSSLISGEVLSRLLAKKNKARRPVLYPLEFFDVFGRDVNKQRVTIVQSRCYQCANCLFTGVLVYETMNSGYIAKVVFVELKVEATWDVIDMSDSSITPRFLMTGEGKIVVPSKIKDTFERVFKLLFDAATRNSVLLSFSWSLFTVIQLLSSAIQACSLKVATAASPGTLGSNST